MPASGAHRLRHTDVSVKLGSDDGWETARYGEEHPRWFSYWTLEAFDAALTFAGFRILDAELRQGTQDTWLIRTCTPDSTED